jgi:hypothetical protein
MTKELLSSFEAYSKSPYLSVKHSNYFDVYDKLFSRFVGKEIVFVEVGVLNGGSMFMWRSFFGDKARIIGIDLNPGALKWEEHGFEIYIGSQSDPVFWEKIRRTVGEIDILLDDGGHTYEQQIVTFEAMLPAIRDGGLLVVEDTHTSYMREFGGPSRTSFVEYAKNVVDGINHRFSLLKDEMPCEWSIHAVQFFESFVAFDVNRNLASKPSSYCSNGGITSEAKDFRYDDISSRQIVSTAGARFRFLKQVPILGPLIHRIYNELRLTGIRRRNRSLASRFKY